MRLELSGSARSDFKTIIALFDLTFVSCQHRSASLAFTLSCAISAFPIMLLNGLLLSTPYPSLSLFLSLSHAREIYQKSNKIVHYRGSIRVCLAASTRTEDQLFEARGTKISNEARKFPYIERRKQLML